MEKTSKKSKYDWTPPEIFYITNIVIISHILWFHVVSNVIANNFLIRVAERENYKNNSTILVCQLVIVFNTFAIKVHYDNVLVALCYAPVVLITPKKIQFPCHGWGLTLIVCD